MMYRKRINYNHFVVPISESLERKISSFSQDDIYYSLKIKYKEIGTEIEKMEDCQGESRFEQIYSLYWCKLKMMTFKQILIHTAVNFEEGEELSWARNTYDELSIKLDGIVEKINESLIEMTTIDLMETLYSIEEKMKKEIEDHDKNRPDYQ
ncbi:MAG TPA: hypothetical protein DCW90_09010 [Lachnospiraceae bacterium]|nr:hypothetical protein [Lachnospiraceae bacterium]